MKFSKKMMNPMHNLYYHNLLYHNLHKFLRLPHQILMILMNILINKRKKKKIIKIKKKNNIIFKIQIINGMKNKIKKKIYKK